MQKSACQRGRFSVNTSLLLTNASRKRKPDGAAGHRKQSRTSPRQTENLASQHRLQLRVEGFPSGQREQTVNLSSLTSVVRIHSLPPKNRLAFVSLFFYPLRKQWHIIKGDLSPLYLISPSGLYIITPLGVYQKCFRNDDIQRLAPLMISTALP